MSEYYKRKDKNTLLGTIVNTVAIVMGGLLGLLFGRALTDKIKTTVIQGIGLAVLLIGLSMALQTQNPLVLIASLVIGGIMGEIIDIELRLRRFGQWLEKNISHGGESGRFTKAFVTASLIYCVGAMAIMGSLESGIKGNHSILYAKSMLDGISAVVFASSMGAGVIVAAVPVFLYQGGITLSAGLIQGVLSSTVIAEMSATGGLLILGIGLNILEITEIRVGNLLPAIFAAIPLTLILTALNIG
ncbi:DUF554 domain-containing protein [Paradesulfitobacterium aromaticivorans]